MSKHARILTPVILAMIVLSGCFGCVDEYAPNQLSLNPSGPITLTVGENTSLSTSTLPIRTSDSDLKIDPGTTTFASSDPSVATVDANSGSSGTARITCVGPGTATITITNVNKVGTTTATVSVTCKAAPPPRPSIDVTPSSVPFNHTVGTTTCPQKIGTLRITSRVSQAVDVTITPESSFITVASKTVTLQPQGSADVDVFFNCATATSFSTTITVTGTNAGGSDTKTVIVSATIAR